MHGSKLQKKLKKKGIIIVLNGERGSTFAGNNILMALLILMFTIGFVFVGGVVPANISKTATDNKYVIIPPPPRNAEDSLQMQTFSGVTTTPIPTPTPVPCPVSNPATKKCASPAERSALVAEVLGNKNLVLRSGREASQRRDIESELHCNTVSLIASLLTLNIPIRINSLKADHSVDGGFHPKGQAIDLGYHVRNGGDGVKVYEFLHKNHKQLKVQQIIWGYPPNLPGIDPGRKCIGQLGSPPGQPVDCDAFFKPGTMSQHADHIHTSVHAL